MTDHLREDLRATSGDLLRDAQRIARIERRKLDDDVSEEEIQRLAAESERVAADINRKSHIQSRLADELSSGDR